MLETLSQQMNWSDEKLQCMLCEMRSTQLGRHIVSKHKMTTHEYKMRFPGARTSILSTDQITKMMMTKRSQDSKHKQTLIAAANRADETRKTGLIELKCQLCDKTSMNSLISHITRTHNMSMNDYRRQFPGEIVQQASPSQRANLSKVMKEKLSNPIERYAFLQWRSFPSEIKHWIRKGFDPREAQEKVAEFQQRQSLKGNNEVTRANRSLKNSGLSNPMSLVSIAVREGVTEDEAKKFTPCFGRTGEAHPMFGKKHTEEALKLIGQHINHSGKSRIEHEMSNAIIALYGGQKNAPIHGWCCDYVNHNQMIVIEFFGDFWHHNPRLYESSFVNRLTKRSSQQVWDRDARKLAELRELGYEVIVIWEFDWRTDKNACMKRIKDAFDRTL